MKLPISLLLVSIGLMLSSGTCHKHPHKVCDNQVLFFYTGEVETDGCDWLVAINGERYRPATLDESMKRDSLIARANFSLTGDTFYCGWGNKYPIIEFTCFEYLEK